MNGLLTLMEAVSAHKSYRLFLLELTPLSKLPVLPQDHWVVLLQPGKAKDDLYSW